MNETSPTLSYEERQKLLAEDIQVIRKQLIEVFKSAGVSTISVEYSGYGDSGQIDEIFYIGPDNTNPKFNDQADISVPTFDLWGNRSITVNTIKAALEDIFYNYLEDCVSGFENNEGGNGEFTWIIADDVIELEHRQAITEYEYSNYTL
jgi:hypothetical protein